jgi:putative glutamine amidotransferase
MQVMNVARGGTLHQHLPELDLGVVHRREAPGETATHEVELVRGTRLAELMGGTRLSVNSFHHQGLADLGRGVRAIGHAGDGTVEAVQIGGGGFALGVQWHAELLVERTEHLALFNGLVRAAASRADDTAEAA